jgi:hypothetical protein
MSEDTISIISLDGKTFRKEKRVLRFSPTLSKLLDDSSVQVLKYDKFFLISLNFGKEIKLDYHSLDLEIVLDYMQRHADAEVDPTLNNYKLKVIII